MFVVELGNIVLGAMHIKVTAFIIPWVYLYVKVKHEESIPFC